MKLSFYLDNKNFNNATQRGHKQQSVLTGFPHLHHEFTLKRSGNSTVNFMMCADNTCTELVACFIHF